MALSAITNLFSRINTYLTDKRTHRAAKKKEAHNRKAREKRWHELRYPRPPSQQLAGVSDNDNRAAEQAQRVLLEPEARRAAPLKRPTRTLNLHSSTFTLDLGRVPAAEVFYRTQVYV